MGFLAVPLARQVAWLPPGLVNYKILVYFVLLLLPPTVSSYDRVAVEQLPNLKFLYYCSKIRFAFSIFLARCYLRTMGVCLQPLESRHTVAPSSCSIILKNSGAKEFFRAAGLVHHNNAQEEVPELAQIVP